MVNKVREGFMRASRENIPVVDFDMVHMFYVNNPDYLHSECRGVRSVKAMRADYALEAVGYVQLKREGGSCTVLASVTPETRLRNKPYSVEVVVDETGGGSIELCKCLDCPASEGGCKHGLALLSWLWKKSSEPSVTSAQCYWKMSSLSAVAKYGEVARSHTLSKQPELPVTPAPVDCRKEFEEKRGQTVMSLCSPPLEELSLHQLALKFIESTGQPAARTFVDFIKETVPQTAYISARSRTCQQSTTPAWHELRYGRVTASIAHQVSRCKLSDGSLVEVIMGASSFKPTAAIKRGIDLEASVLKKVDPKYTRTGLYISPELPFLAASPDGLGADCVLEVKCPSKDATVSNYLNEDDTLTPKCKAQVHMQMYLTGKRKAKFCVASPRFEEDQTVKVVEVVYDSHYTDELIRRITVFWEKAIFPKLIEC